MTKRKVNYVLVGILIVIIPIMLCVGAYFIFNLKNKPENKWLEYVNLLKEEKYEDMYKLLDSKSRGKITEEDFVARNKNIYTGIKASNMEVNVTNVEKDSGNYKVTYDTKMTTLAGDIQFSNSVKVVKELRDGYKINWSSNLIFPELGDEDKVRVDTVKSKRGSIIDRNGDAIATDSFVSSVGIVPGKLGDDKNNNINKIAKLLNISTDSINKALSASYVKDDMFVPIKDIKYQSEEIPKLLEIPGVKVQDKDSRVYPHGKVTAHLTGYVQKINDDELKERADKNYTANSIIGKAGLEKMYEDSLRGIDGVKIYIQTGQGEKKTDLLSIDPKNGQDLTLTIDMNTQSLLYDEIKDDKGTSVAMNPQTGELLALVSTPSYDPNSFVIGMSDSEWNTLNNDANKPMFNRFQGTFAPGSSMKPITAVIGVDTNKINPNDVKNIQGLGWQKDSSWGNYNVTRVNGSYGEANLKNALVYSDNIYFAQAALDIGKDLFKEKLTSFGYGEKIPCDFALYSSQISNDGEFKNEISLADSGYGQADILVNPVHLTSMYTMFVNGGNIMKPKLFMNGSGPEIWKQNVVNKASSDLIFQDLLQVVSEPGGTAHSIYDPKITIAGKTGTAEIKKTQDDTEGTELGWFVAMTTNKSPNNILVSMMVEDVKNRGGSHYVVPKVGKALVK